MILRASKLLYLVLFEDNYYIIEFLSTEKDVKSLKNRNPKLYSTASLGTVFCKKIAKAFISCIDNDFDRIKVIQLFLQQLLVTSVAGWFQSSQLVILQH